MWGPALAQPTINLPARSPACVVLAMERLGSGELELFRFGKREKAMAVVIALVKSRLDSEVVMTQA